MSELVLGSEILNRALEGRRPGRGELRQLMAEAMDGPSELLGAARALRDRSKGTTVTFSKKAFVNITNMCRDVCSYCTYRAGPGGQAPVMMSRRQVAGLLELAAKYRCVEALFVAGERPEGAYPEARAWLAENGFASTAEYVSHMSAEALELGLFAHTNAGNLTQAELADLQRTNVSVGIMLESSSRRLMGSGGAHELAPSKEPGARLGVLKSAGRLGLPTTTGVLLGIGETPDELADSLADIRDVSDSYGTIQEVIVQNFQPKEGTAMSGAPPATQAYLAAAAALARVAMPDMNVQAPPNLSPGTYAGLLDAGINDWGGVSPLTPDHVNPEFAWPAIAGIEEECRRAGRELKCRFPVYPEFAGMVPRDLRDRMAGVADGQGHVSGDRWRGGP